MKKKSRKAARKPVKPKSKKKLKKKATRPRSRPRPKKKTKPRKVVKPSVKPIVKPKRRKKDVLKESVVSGNTPNAITVLEQLFGGQSKMKLCKVFLLNTSKEFTLKHLSTLTRVNTEKIIVDLRDLMKQGMITAVRKHVISDTSRRESQIVYKVNPSFPLLNPLIETILAAVPRSSEKVVEHMQSLPKLKIVLLSGFFTSKLGLTSSSTVTAQSPIDMLLVFDKIPHQVNARVAELERGLGRELRYAALEQEDFKYRHSIGDKLIRDVLDFEHVVALDRMGFFK